MLDVHAPHDAPHTFKSFFIHIATIVVGLFIAVGLEQSVEALHRHHEVALLRDDLQAESRQLLGDARQSESAHSYELRWLAARIAQTQAALRERHALGPREPNAMPNYTSPDLPIWRSAKAAGRSALLSKGEVNAYAEIEYVQAHVEALEFTKSAARYAVRSFNRQYPALPDGSPDLAAASGEELHFYLGLLTSAYEVIDAYIHWFRIIIGAESAVVDGKMALVDIYAAERKSAASEVLRNFM